jgi:hypothetical protein
MNGRPLLFLVILAAAAAKADVVVTRQDFMTGLTLAVGARFRVPPSANNARWTVTYPRAIVRALTRPDRMEHPDARGWRFETIARGSGELTFIGLVPPDGADRPNPPKFVLQVTVR